VHLGLIPAFFDSPIGDFNT